MSLCFPYRKRFWTSSVVYSDRVERGKGTGYGVAWKGDIFERDGEWGGEV